jgi:hypothetical protein
MAAAGTDPRCILRGSLSERRRPWDIQGVLFGRDDRIWADCDLIHVLIGSNRIKTVRATIPARWVTIQNCSWVTIFGPAEWRRTPRQQSGSHHYLRWAIPSRETPTYPAAGAHWWLSHTVFATSFDHNQRQLSADVRW